MRPGLIAIALASGLAISAEWAAQARNSAVERFEVASVHELDPAARGLMEPGLRITPGRIHYASVPLEGLIRYAFAMSDQQRMLGGPAWVHEEGAGDALFVVDATYPDSARSRIPAMMQSLLRERFSLEAHFEERQENVSWLRAGTLGPKLRIARPEGPSLLPYPCPPESRPCITLLGRARTISDLAESLSTLAGEPIFDGTGLRGAYDYAFSYPIVRPSQLLQAPPNFKLPSHRSVPSLSTSLRVQLGLRLERGRGAVNDLLLDHVQQLRAN